MSQDREKIEGIFQKYALQDFRWINPGDIVVSQWVRTKCMFGCNEYGKSASCPPNVPPVAECERFFREYSRAVLFHFTNRVTSREELRSWIKKIHAGLIGMEKDVFLSGCEKAFILLVDSCCLCAECVPRREECRHPKQSRPTVEAFAVDVYTTARSAGYSIQVRTDPEQAMDRFALLMID